MDRRTPARPGTGSPTKVPARKTDPGDFYYVQRLMSDTSLVVRPDAEFAEGEHFVTIEALGENLSAFMLDETARGAGGRLRRLRGDDDHRRRGHARTRGRPR